MEGTASLVKTVGGEISFGSLETKKKKIVNGRRKNSIKKISQEEKFELVDRKEIEIHGKLHHG